MSKKLLVKCLNVLTWVFLAYGLLFFGLLPGIGFDNLDAKPLILKMTMGFSLAFLSKLLAWKLDPEMSGQKSFQKSLTGGLKIVFFIVATPVVISLVLFLLFVINESLIKKN